MIMSTTLLASYIYLSAEAIPWLYPHPFSTDLKTHSKSEDGVYTQVSRSRYIVKGVHDGG
jgi:hypothetical protein